MSLKARLTWMSGVSVLATLALAVIVTVQLGQLIDRFDAFRTTSVVAEKYTLMINRDLNYCSRLTRSIMLGDDYEKNYAKLGSRISDIEGHFDNLRDAIEQLPVDSRELLTAVANSQRDTLAFVEDGRRRMIALKPNHADSQARADAWQAYKREASPVANSARGSFRTLQQMLDEHIDRNTQQMEAAMDDARSLSMIIAVIVALVIALGLGNAYLVRQTMSRLNRMRSTMASLSENSNLTERVPVTGSDELSQTASVFNAMLEQFQKMIEQFARSSQQVAAAAGQLGQVSSQGMTDQRTQSDEIATVVSAMQQMHLSVGAVSDDAQQAAGSAQQAKDHSHQGIDLTNDAVRLMDDLSGQTEQTHQAVSQLSESCARINSVLSVIQTVSEQTNLLALNAAIEAARAGDQGRGFAVVADEVRTLAIRSQDSTREIQEIIDQLMKRSDSAVAAMTENQRLANESKLTTQGVLNSMAAVVEAIDAIEQMNADIARSSTEQSQVASEVNNTVTRLQQLSDNTQQSALEVDSASGELASTAEQLQTAIGRFRYQ